MKLIDPQDLVILNDFFRTLFCNDSFAYTLFGHKPMACIVGFGSLCTESIIHYIGWKVWQKYAYLFPSCSFYFIQCLHPDFPRFLDFTLINKEKCLDVINRHLSVFKGCFGAEKTAQDMLQMVCSPDFLDLHDKREGFFLCSGLLFGYGEKNSKAFERRNLLIQTLYQAPYHLQTLNERIKNKQEYFYVGLQKKILSINIQQPLTIQPVIEELNELHQTYKIIFLVNKHSLCPLGSLRCAGFENDKETKAIQLEYENECQRLVDIYNSENFLELVLTQLSS